MVSVSPVPKKHNLVDIRHFNTLHSFQYLGDEYDDGDAGFVACLYFDPLERALVPRSIQRLFESVVKLAEFAIQGDYWTIGRRTWFAEYNGKLYAAVANRSDAPAVIDALLSLGCSVQPWTALAPLYKPCDGQYSIETSERIILQTLQQQLASQRGRSSDIPSYYRAHLVLDHRLWKTQEGKLFARSQLQQHPQLSSKYSLDKKLFVPFGSTTSFDPTIDWPPLPEPFTNTAPIATGVNVDSTTRIDHQDDAEMDDDATCIVCLVKPANTMVLPCEHIVVCKSCSDALRGTLNEKRCVKCRDAITDVLADSN